MVNGIGEHFFNTNSISFYNNINCGCDRNHRLYSPKKVVFSEPYEIVPSYLINNDFKKGKCNYCKKNKEQSNSNSSFGLPFLPFLGSMMSGGGGLGNLIGMLGSNLGQKDSPLNNILSNKDFVNSITSMLFKNSEKSKVKHEDKCEDFDLDDYTRVE